MGKPIIAYSIENAKQTGLFDEIMVSTDDPDIMEIAQKYGASIPFIRSDKTANDYATLADVLFEVIHNYSERGKTFDNMCCILATCPLIKSTYISDAYIKLIHSNFTTICPIVKYSYPILRSYNMDENGKITMNWPEYEKARSQDLPPSYHDSGTFYWHKISPWLVGNRNRGGIIVDEELVQDIDTEHDWKIAEMKYKLIYNSII